MFIDVSSNKHKDLDEVLDEEGEQELAEEEEILDDDDPIEEFSESEGVAVNKKPAVAEINLKCLLFRL